MPLFELPRKTHDNRSRQLVRIGRELENEDRFNEALQAYEAALRIEPDYPDALYGRGRSLHGLARRVNADAGGPIYFKAGVELLDDAIASFERLVRIDPSADAYANLALAYDNRSRISEAEAAYLTAIQIDPEGEDGCDACFNLALLYYMRAQGMAGRLDLKTATTQPEDKTLISKAFEMSKEAASIADRIATTDETFGVTAAIMHRRLAN